LWQILLQKIWVELDRAVEQPQRLVVRLPVNKQMRPGQTAQIEGIGIETLGRLALGTLDLGFFNRWRDRPDNALSHLVLQTEDVAEPAIKPVRPKMCPGGGIDKLSRDAHSVCRFANAPFQHVTHPSSRPTTFTSTARPLYVKLELRAITSSDLKRDSAVMMSSTIPSAKYSCSESPDMFWNGSTAMEGLSGNASGIEALSNPAAVPFIATAKARTGSSIFLTCCAPKSLNSNGRIFLT
jgi:hypothetical protein